MKQYWKNRAIAALKTVAQTLAGYLTGAALISTVDWRLAFSAAVLAGAYSLLMSVVNMPSDEDEPA